MWFYRVMQSRNRPPSIVLGLTHSLVPEACHIWSVCGLTMVLMSEAQTFWISKPLWPIAMLETVLSSVSDFACEYKFETKWKLNLKPETVLLVYPNHSAVVLWHFPHVKQTCETCDTYLCHMIWHKYTSNDTKLLIRLYKGVYLGITNIEHV